MAFHKAKVLAELSGTLMSVDSEDVRVGDIHFGIGGHAVRRITVAPHRPTADEKTDPEHFAYCAVPLDALAGWVGYTYQIPIGAPTLVLRPTEPKE